ncbi:hypothetical protein [Brachybacterium phenoliresistens]|uniref:hypothetical protein n=1 Tax=Brachybacterium phenoliresistens TaxID=396014 RepID=UPI0031D43E96
MTVRPRYTARQKTKHICIVAAHVATAIAPALQLGLQTVVLILETRYTDPKESR